MITNIAVHLPPDVLSSEQLAKLYPDWTAEKIYEKTGIRERRVVWKGECASDLAYAAASRLLAMEPTKSAHPLSLR